MHADRLSTRDLLRTTAFAGRLVWDADRRRLLGIVSVQLVTALSLAGVVVAVKRLADGGAPRTAVIPLLLATVALVTVNALLRQLTQSWQRLLAAQTDRRIAALVLRTASQAELLELEQPSFYDRLQRAAFAARAQPVVLVTGLVALLQALLGAVAIGGAVLLMAWWLLPLCALVPLPLLRAAKRERDARLGLHRGLAESRRRR